MERYKINKKLLRKVREHDNFCLCERGKMCPCEEFLEKDICRCGVFLKENKHFFVEDDIIAENDIKK